MRSAPAIGVLLAVAACASPAPHPAELSQPASPEPPRVECGGLDDALCTSVTDAARLMTGTAPLEVDALPIPSGGGTPIAERYVVSLEPEVGTGEPQLVEVVRFEGADNWSVRRLERMPDD
jgi:hypothetical protein